MQNCAYICYYDGYSQVLLFKTFLQAATNVSKLGYLASEIRCRSGKSQISNLPGNYKSIFSEKKLKK